MSVLRPAAAAYLLTLAITVAAADLPLSFDEPRQQQRYAALLEELRCLVCQNQSLADSHAELAQDLRNEVYRMVGEGHDNSTVIDFMVARYGDFVLYRPPLKRSTWLLWSAPLLLLLVAGGVLVRLARRRNSVPPLSAAERARLDKLLEQRRDES